MKYSKTRGHLTKLFFVLFILSNFLSCKVWRWYKLKRQLKDVPKNFSIERDVENKNDFVIMKKPVLKSSDVYFLAKKIPTQVIKKPTGNIEIYKCIRKDYPEYSFAINAHYNKKGYLYRIDPPNILTNAYDDYTYNRIGNLLLGGDIDALDYEIRAKYKNDDSRFDILDKKRIEKALGPPDKDSTENFYSYSYTVDTETKATDDIFLDVKLTFAFDNRGVIKDIHFNFATVNLYFHYEE